MNSPVELDYSLLSTEALRGVVDAHVLQEGTDYGHEDISLQRKREQVMKQLERREASVFFDPETETAIIGPGPRAR